MFVNIMATLKTSTPLPPPAGDITNRLQSSPVIYDAVSCAGVPAGLIKD